MRILSLFNPRNFRFATIRNQLSWSYATIIVAVLTLVAAFGWLFVDYYTRVDELLSLNAATSTITIKMEETHQLLENAVNYEDPSYIAPFIAKRDDFTSYVKAYDADARRTAILLNDYNAYYEFLEIQKLVFVYVQESDILLYLLGSGTGRGMARYDLYDKLYSLRDLNFRAYQLQAALLVRQNSYTRTFYNEYSPVVSRRLVAISAFAGLMILSTIFWALRQAVAISKPLHRLTSMHLELASGNFNVDEQFTVRNIEISELVTAFGYMARKISESMKIDRQKSALEKRALLMESSLKQAKLEVLQAQINPHFLFNALNTVKSLSQIEDAPRTEEIIEALAVFLRYNLDKLESQVSMAEEFSITENYLKIQQMRFGKRLSFDISLDSELHQLQIPSLLIQPLVENCIVHGLEPLKDGGKVLLRGRLESGRAIVEVIDNGVGMDTKTIAGLEKGLENPFDTEGNHVGIRNTWRRLMLTDPGATLEFSQTAGGGTTVVLSIAAELCVPPDCDSSTG